MKLSLTTTRTVPVLTLLFCMLLVSNCKKTSQPAPSASFTLNEDGYSAGDTVVVTNTSVSSDLYSWTLTGPDGKVAQNTPNGYFAENMTTYQFPLRLSMLNSPDGRYSLKLRTAGINSTKLSDFSKDFTVRTTRARVNVYVRSLTMHTYNVFADSEIIGSVGPTPNSDVVVVSYLLPIGNRTIGVRFSAVVISKQVTLAEGQTYDVHLD